MSLLTGTISLGLTLGYALIGDWFVHHPKEWLDEKSNALPGLLSNSLMSFGNFTGDITDSLGLTGSDVVHEYDLAAPEGSVFFAGAPKRTGNPAPADIMILNRGEFVVGWSPSWQHPVWVAYHVPREVKYRDLPRPNFTKDKQAPNAPAPSAYTHTGYDRGHMAPNHAIASRFGAEAQKLTFLTSNIAPQTPELNRGVWRDIEHRISDFWTARYGEIWVIVGCLKNNDNQTLAVNTINVPTRFYQLIVAQEGLDVRVLAMMLDQNVSYGEYAARHLITIDELEKRTGLDFLPELPQFMQSQLESELPTRLWPIRFRDILSQILMRCR